MTTFLLPTVYFLLNSHFFIRQIASRIFGPEVARHRLGTRAEVAIAQIQESALRTTSLQKRLAVLEPRHNRVRQVRPNIARAAFANIPQRDILRKLVRMHIADAIDIAKRHTTAVTAITLNQF